MVEPDLDWIVMKAIEKELDEAAKAMTEADEPKEPRSLGGDGKKPAFPFEPEPASVRSARYLRMAELSVRTKPSCSSTGTA